jgi:activator of HSP90 ATPase
MPRIHQEVSFAASAAKIYSALTDSDVHSRFTGAPAEISSEEGGAFSCYGGRVVGRNLELVTDKRIVQAWRPADWPEGVYTIARFELQSQGQETKLVFDQDGIPDDAVSHLEAGWSRMYWEPLRKFLEG